MNEQSASKNTFPLSRSRKVIIGINVVAALVISISHWIYSQEFESWFLSYDTSVPMMLIFLALVHTNYPSWDTLQKIVVARYMKEFNCTEQLIEDYSSFVKKRRMLLQIAGLLAILPGQYLWNYFGPFILGRLEYRELSRISILVYLLLYVIFVYVINSLLQRFVRAGFDPELEHLLSKETEWIQEERRKRTMSVKTEKEEISEKNASTDADETDETMD